MPLPVCAVGSALPSCPDPKLVFDGTKCPSEGAQCPGNPLSCDGAIFYDAFVCKGGVFVTTAATTCGDGGYPDRISSHAEHVPCSRVPAQTIVVTRSSSGLWIFRRVASCCGV